MDFVTVNQAHKIIRNAVLKPVKKQVSLLESLGYYTANDILATMDVPSFDNSAMDGYGISFLELSNHTKFQISATIQAGDTKISNVQKGDAVRIFTGAPIPKGIDTIIAQEDCSLKDGYLEFDSSKVKFGDHVRLKGSQTQKDSLIVPKNTYINAGILGFLSGFGLKAIEVFAKPKVGIIITGKELIEAGKPLESGQIYESNGVSLNALLLEMGIKSVFTTHVEDDLNTTENTIQEAISKVDILIITGGISVGEFDYVKEALERNEVAKQFYKIKQKPGKPIFFGTKNNKAVFALPGNPAAVFSGFHIYVKPFLKACFSDNSEFLQEQTAILSNNYKKKASLTHWVKGVLNNDQLTILGGQESYKMDAFVQANVLARLESELEIFSTGDKISVILI